MSTEKLERRLTAILALDIAGYSRMMGRDEEGTLGRLNHIRRSIIDSTIARHEGSIVKTTGDGVLAEFKSARDAIVAAREIQDLLHSYNEGQPAAERMDARIGVNIGDVIHHDGDVFGDGVNIAARLEAEAPAGGICISGRALDDLRKLACVFEDRGEVLLKNIENPVRVLCVPPPRSEAREAAAARAPPPPEPPARTAGPAPARTTARQGPGPWLAAALAAVAAIILAVVLIGPRSHDPARLRARDAVAAGTAAMPADAAPARRRRREAP